MTEMERASIIAEVARELARVVPPPRGAPYFLLDAEVSYDLKVLDAFSARGIFRKYESVLLVGRDLGGTARWLASRFGCRVLGVDARVAAVRAAAILNRRAHMDEQVRFQVGRTDCLPLRATVFTHVWILEPLGPNVVTIFAELFRVLRPGGHVALQSPLLDEPARHDLTGAMRATGFVEIEAREARLADLADGFRLARKRLRAALRETGERCAEIRPRASRCMQVFARRPS